MTLRDRHAYSAPSLPRRLSHLMLVLAEKNTTMLFADSCPRCGSNDVRRSTRVGSGERLLGRFTPWKPYRCRDCNHRFWALPPRQGRPEADGEPVTRG